MTGLLSRHEAAQRQLPEAYSVAGASKSTSPQAGTFEHINPSTGRVQAGIAMVGAEFVDQAVGEARRACAAWRATPGARRRQILERLAQLVVEHGDELSVLATLEAGITHTYGRASFVPAAYAWINYYAGWADRLEGLVTSSNPAEPFIYTVPEPVGVVAIIISWNAPLLSLAMKVAPALAAGNTVVLKPAEMTPFTAVRFFELAKQAGLPDGVLNIVLGQADAGAALIGHEGVDKISFTGGLQTAQRIMAGAAQPLTPVLFELGGKGANILFEDADLAQAVPFSASRAMVLAGQGCVLPTRMLVHASIYDEVVAGVVKNVADIRIGDPLEAGTFTGPVISASACDRISGMIDQAKQQGSGELVAGGNRCNGDLGDGFFIEPTVFANVDPESDLGQKELFGPVLSITPFSSEDEAVHIANGTQYGLSSYVHTHDLRRARRMADQLRSGTVSINAAPSHHYSAPFGGIGKSGFGREGGKAGIEEFINMKTILIS